MNGEGGADQRVQVAESGGRIGERIERLSVNAEHEKEDIRDMREDIRALRADVDALKRFQAWIFGIGTGLGATAALLANGLKDWLKT